jgi:Rrf2 family protein
MLKLPKKVEYAILALQYLAQRDGTLVAVKEISSELEISFEFMSKTFQSLIKAGIVGSQKGARGGYFLTVAPSDLTLGMVIDALDSRPSLVDCTDPSGKGKCEREETCTIKNPITTIQSEINKLFDQMTFKDLITEEYSKKEIYTIELNRKETENA